jgi:putative ABC transport system ATP-binding protein
VIRLEKVNKTYHVGAKPLHVLKDVDLTIDPGELVSVMGSSGSGKSTLLNLLGLLDEYDSGAYWLDGELLRDPPPKRAAALRNRTIGFVFQSFNLLSFKSAAENVALPLYYRGVPRKKRLARAREELARVGLADWTEHRPSELSGGEQQRVAIARALVTEPKLILADEPTGALDSETSNQVMSILHEVNAAGMTVVVVTHEQEIAARTQRTIRLRDGVVLE